MTIDGPIKTFAEFNNDNCRNGYLYFNQRDDLRISMMPSKRILDTPWPLQRIPFKQTGRKFVNLFLLEHRFFFLSVQYISCAIMSKAK